MMKGRKSGGSSAQYRPPWFIRPKRFVRQFVAWLVQIDLLSWPSSIVAVVAAYVTLVNVGVGTTVHFIDNLWPADPRGYLYTLQFAWLPQRMGFYNALSLIALPYTSWAALLQTAGLDSSAQEILTVALLEFGTGYFGYKLLRNHILRAVDPRVRTVLSLGGALCLMNNYFVQSVFWWDFIPEGFVMMAFGLAFLYYSLQTFEGFFVRGRIPTIPLVGMILTSTIAFSVGIPFNLSILFASVLLPPIVILNHPSSQLRKRRLLVFSGLNLLVILATSLWWIYPSYMFTQLQPGYLGNNLTQSQSLQTFQSTTSSQTFLVSLSGIVGYPFSSVGHTSATTFISDYIGTGLSILMVFVVGFALLVKPRTSAAALPYTVASALFLTLFMTGVNSPLYPTVFNLAFRNNILLTAFRTPFVSLGYGFMIFWISAIALAADKVVRWLAELWAQAKPSGLPFRRSLTDAQVRTKHNGLRSSAIPMALALAIVVVPILASAPAAYIGDAVPISPYQSHAQIPGYEVEVADFLQENLHDDYALLYPGGFLNQGGSGGYEGFDVLPSLLPNSFLIDNYRQGFVAADNPLLDQAYQELSDYSTRDTSFAALLDQLAVRYIVVEGGLKNSTQFGQAIEPNYDLLLAELNATQGLTLVATIGPDYIYTVDGTPPLVSIAGASINETSLAGNSSLQQVNLTQAFYNSSLVNLPGAPFHSFAPTYADGSIIFNINRSVRLNLSETAFPAPIGPSTPPTVFNGYPLRINTSIFPDLILDFSTNDQTAISVSVITLENLSGASPSEVEANTFNVVAPHDNLGSGDVGLVGAYGYNHFTSPDHSTTLVADLASTLGTSSNRTVDYVLIEVLPVEGGSGVAPGTPVTDWPGTQELQIHDFGVGSNLFDPPTFASQYTPLAVAPVFHSLNVTAEYARGLFASSNDTPIRHLYPINSNPITLEANLSEKANWPYYEVGVPFPSGGPPTFLNAIPMGLNVTGLTFLDINFTTSPATAFDAAVTTVANLSRLDTAQLNADLHYLGGSPSNLGPGDPLLFDSYGGLHYDTNSNGQLLDDNLAGTLSINPNSTLTYVVLQLFYVNETGNGVKNLPVSDWPENQTISIRELSLADYGTISPNAMTNGSIVGRASPIFASPLEPLSPHTVVTESGIQGPFNNGTLQLDVSSPTSITVWVREASTNESPFLIVFHETDATGWTLVPLSNVRNWKPTVIDGAMDGFLVYPARGQGSLSFQLSFEPQTAFEIALYGGLAIPIVCSVAIFAVARWRTRNFVE